MAQNYYDILGITRDATAEEIKRAYKKAALTHHPDKGGDEDKFKECGAAVETLTDERKRAAYDSTLIRLRSKDGLGSGFPRFTSRDSSNERPRPSGGASKPTTSQPPHVPQPPKAKKHVEIPSDPGSLSIKELKELLTALGIDHEGCLEKADLLALLRDRKERRSLFGQPATVAVTDAKACTHRNNGVTDPHPVQSWMRFKRHEETQSTRQSLSTDSGDTPREMPKAPPASSASGSSSGSRALRVKVMSIGSATVGKSTLIKRYCESRFVQKYIPTIGIDYGVKPVRVLGHDLKVNFFDTSGGDEFREIRTEFYTMGQASAVLLVYDVTNRKSFADLSLWLEEAQAHGCPLSRGRGSCVALCANKLDLGRRAVSRAEGEDFAVTHGMRYFETSAATGEQVTEAMNYLFEQAVNHHHEIGRKILGWDDPAQVYVVPKIAMAAG